MCLYLSQRKSSEQNDIYLPFNFLLVGFILRMEKVNPLLLLMGAGKFWLDVSLAFSGFIIGFTWTGEERLQTLGLKNKQTL